MDSGGFALFATPIGDCGIAWRGAALVGVHLPEVRAGAARANLHRRFPELTEAEPPAWVTAVIGDIRRLLAGETVEFGTVPLDLDGVGTFEASVYRAAQRIPPGRTVTYGELAATVGDKGAARAVGQALGRNPWPIVVPCHRITAADGRTGGFSAPGGAATKLRLLEIEGALAPETLPLFGGN